MIGKSPPRQGELFIAGSMESLIPDDYVLKQVDAVQDIRRAIRLGIEENADMVAAYPMWSFFPWNEAHSPERVQAWDEELPPLTP